MDGTGSGLTRKESIEYLAARPWQRPPPPPSRWRWLVAGLALLLHAGLAWLWAGMAGVEPVRESRLQISFIQRPQAKPAASMPIPAATTQPALPVARPRAADSREVNKSADALAETPAATSKLKLYGLDGRLQLAEDALEQIDAGTANGRAFEFQQPGLDKAEALMREHVAIEYVPTRFDKYWKPEETLLDEILRKAVEMSTKTVKIPIPGAPNDKLVCQVVLLAAGGGCYIQSNGAGELVELDDPDTLSPEEDRQCGQWWAQITEAKGQSEWRRTRRLYEQYCRKPLQRKPSPPAQQKGLQKEP